MYDDSTHAKLIVVDRRVWHGIFNELLYRFFSKAMLEGRNSHN